MAAQLYLLSRANADVPSRTNIDDVHIAIVNSDDGGADAVKIAEAEAAIIGAGIPLNPQPYFDTVELLGPPTAGIMTTDEDTIVFTRRGRVEIIA